MTEDIRFYMQKDDSDVCIDLEAYFGGLKYSKCKGLTSKGKRKNIYFESYSDSDELRVWQGETVVREATTIVFTFYFIGDNRQQVYDDFYDYVKNGQIYYWDTKRNKRAYLVLEEAVDPKEDVYQGSTPYLCADFKFQNLWGECIDVE